MTTSFEIVGFDNANDRVKTIIKETQRQVDLASKLGVNKALDQVVYGRTTSINALNSKPNSMVYKASKALRIPIEHIYYRTFVKGVKVSAGRGRLAKPYASSMARGNDINVVDLLLKGSQAKQAYGYSTRKKGVSGKKRPNMKSHAAAARVGGRRSGSVKIGSRTYQNSYIEDGTTRNRSEANNRHYMKKLGAKAFKLAGKRFFLFQKKNKGQKLPYPSKVVKIGKQRVLRALNAAAASSLRINGSKIGDIQSLEVNKRLKKLGFELK